MATTKTVSHAKPKAAAKKPSAADKAKAAVEKMRQASLTIPMPEPAAEIVLLPIELIQVHAQVRTEFNEETIRELAEDIAERGVIQPILVRAVDGGYLVVAGERRYRAAKLAQLPTVPAIVSSINDETAAAVQIAENIQREDLSLADTAKAVRKLYEIHGNSVTVTAAKLHKSKSWVSKHLAASCEKLNVWARELLEDGATEDLEIVLTIDKIAAINYWTAKQVADKVRSGNAGRQSVRDELDLVKKQQEKIEADRQKIAEEMATPEAKAERERRQKEHEQRMAAEAEKRRLDPMNLRWHFDEELADDERSALSQHLEQLHRSGAKTAPDELGTVIIRMHEGEYSGIEVAAFIAGYQNFSFDLDSLIRQTIEATAEE